MPYFILFCWSLGWLCVGIGIGIPRRPKDIPTLRYKHIV
jgi:hypothetical protein